MKAAALGLVALMMSGSSFAKDPDCAYPYAWSFSMAQGTLERAGLLDSSKVDFKKSSVTQIASQRIGKDLYRQIQLVRYVYKTGGILQAVTTHDASHVECSMSDVDVFPVLEKLGDRSDAVGKPLAMPASAPGGPPSTQTPAALARAWLETAKRIGVGTIDAADVTVTPMGSQRLGKNDQLEVHRVRFATRDGKAIEAIVVDNVSRSALQTGKADVYVVSGRLDPCDIVPKDQACPFTALPPPRWLSEKERKAIDDEKIRSSLQRSKE